MSTAQIRFSSAHRREQILDISSGLFAEQGFSGTTTKQIADQAGVTEALIFRHFPSKEDLYWEVIERKINSVAPGEQLQQILEKADDDFETLSRVAFEVLERRAQDQTLSRLLLFSALEKHELSHRFFRNYIADYFAVMERFVQKRIDEGRLRPVNPLLAARSFLGMVIYHSWIQELYGGKHVQDFDLHDVSRTIADIWLRGMRKAAKPERRAKPLSGSTVKKHRVNGNNGKRTST